MGASFDLHLHAMGDGYPAVTRRDAAGQQLPRKAAAATAAMHRPAFAR
jgi:hypothetical protein